LWLEKGWKSECGLTSIWFQLTPSFVQMQLVQGLGKADSPTAVCFPPIVQPETTFSLQALKSICGMEWQGTRGFL
jgi:hypothetical protein